MLQIIVGAEAQAYRAYLDTMKAFEFYTAANLLAVSPTQLLQLTLAEKISPQIKPEKQELWYALVDIENLLPNTVKAYLSAHELAAYCGKSVKQLANMRKYHDGPPFIRHFGLILYPANGVYAWVHNTENPGLAFYLEEQPSSVVELFPTKPQSAGDSRGAQH